MVSLTEVETSNADTTAMVRLRIQIERTLKSSAFDALRDIVCENHGQVIVLRGHVESFFLKQQAQEAVRKIDRRVPIVNMVSVG